MSWIRLYLIVEGETELKFAKETLFPHLAKFDVEVRPRMVLTNRKLGKRGGALGFHRLKRDTIRLMQDDDNKEARFSTMIDLYALSADYPGWKNAEKKPNPLIVCWNWKKPWLRNSEIPDSSRSFNCTNSKRCSTAI